jgi:hypothetical protein
VFRKNKKRERGERKKNIAGWKTQEKSVKNTLLRKKKT